MSKDTPIRAFYKHTICPLCLFRVDKFEGDHGRTWEDNLFFCELQKGASGRDYCTMLDYANCPLAGGKDQRDFEILVAASDTLSRPFKEWKRPDPASKEDD